MKRALLPVFTFAKIDIRRLFRDKVGIFFVFIFPLIFLVVFGSIFAGDGNVSFRVALLNQSDTEFAKQFVQQAQATDVLKIDDEITSIEQAKEKMNRGQIDAAIVLPANFGEMSERGYPTGTAEIQYAESNQQAGETLSSIMNTIFEEINKRFVEIERPFVAEAKSTSTKGLTRFDYTFAGILGFTILSLGIFGPTTVFPRLKEKKVLRRYHTTTLKVWQYFIGNVLSNGAVGLMAVTLMFIVAVFGFDLNMRGNYLILGTVIVMGVTLMFGFGLAIGGWAKNENQAAPLAQIATLPMMFLSGVFFPTFLMPELLQNITRFIPLTPIVDSIRLVVTEGAGFGDLGSQFAIMGAWMVLIYLVAFRVFRWE